MTYTHLTVEDCLARWPRLVRAIQWVALLSRTEAGAALRDYRDAREALAGRDPYGLEDDRPDWASWGRMMMQHGGGEAVNHFGGPLRTLTRAIKYRESHRNPLCRHGGYKAFG